MKIEQLGPFAAKDAASGKRVVTWGNGSWMSFSAGEPVRSLWGETLAKHQRPQIEADKLAVSKLSVGESCTVVKGFHPRHGVKSVIVTRVS